MPRSRHACKRLPGEPYDALEWQFWYHSMTVTHVQRRCPRCGLWHVWVERGWDEKYTAIKARMAKRGRR